ncbi:MAG: hypothetical protein PS018_19725 [bacterium]|nr:hypothetical protein [bacterium]
MSIDGDMILKAEFADSIRDRIVPTARTGRNGDDAVLTTPVLTFARIREIGRRPEKRDD